MIENFLGVRIPPKIVPPVPENTRGLVEGSPDPGNWQANIAPAQNGRPVVRIDGVRMWANPRPT